MPSEVAQRPFIRDDIRPLGECGVDYSVRLLQEAHTYIHGNESCLPYGCRIHGDGVIVPVKPYRYQNMVVIEDMLCNWEICSLALIIGMPYPAVV